MHLISHFSELDGGGGTPQGGHCHLSHLVFLYFSYIIMGRGMAGFWPSLLPRPHFRKIVLQKMAKKKLDSPLEDFYNFSDIWENFNGSFAIFNGF